MVAIIALLFITYWALTWSPGVMTDAKGAPILANGHTIPRPHELPEALAIIGVAATLIGTVLGVYFGFSASARGTFEAVQLLANAKALVNEANATASAASTAETNAAEAKRRANEAERGRDDSATRLGAFVVAVQAAQAHLPDNVPDARSALEEALRNATTTTV